MEMNPDETKVFIFTWKIKNFSFGWRDGKNTIYSPFFNIQANETSSWLLDISPCNGKNYIECNLQKFSGFFPLVDYEISFIGQNGSSLISTQVSGADFSIVCDHHHSVPMMDKTNLLPLDTLTIRLKIWEVECSSLVGKHVFAETEIEVKRGSSLWFVEQFSNLKCGEERAMLLKNSSMDRLTISFNICQEEDEHLKIKVVELSKSVKHWKLNFFLLDGAGERVACGKLDFGTVGKCSKLERKFQLNMKKTDLLEDKTRFLLNDVLLFQCEFAFSTGSIFEKKVDPKIVDNTQFKEKEFAMRSTITADLKSLYTNSILCDTKLQTETESFPVHSVILSARSPVFRTMFATDMIEKTTECVPVEEDAITVRRMLLFLYSDILEDLDWESAKSLYIASDKYDIAYLRHLCASFLKRNLLPSNCCDAVSLADMHQDSNLMSSIQDFMSDHTKEILTSEEWRDFEKKNSLLTSETLRFLCLKNQKK